MAALQVLEEVEAGQLQLSSEETYQPLLLGLSNHLPLPAVAVGGAKVLQLAIP